MRHPLVLALVALVSASVIASPAVADTQRFDDGTGTDGPMDISSVTVKNDGKLAVRIEVDNLRRRVGSSATLWIDAKPKKAGPDFAVISGLYDSDWQIYRTRGWRLTGGPLNCSIGQYLNYNDDVIRFTTGQSCMGDYSRVRVSATTRDDNGNVDHSPGRRALHSWVARN